MSLATFICMCGRWKKEMLYRSIVTHDILELKKVYIPNIIYVKVNCLKRIFQRK